MLIIRRWAGTGIKGRKSSSPRPDSPAPSAGSLDVSFAHAELAQAGGKYQSILVEKAMIPTPSLCFRALFFAGPISAPEGDRTEKRIFPSAGPITTSPPGIPADAGAGDAFALTKKKKKKDVTRIAVPSP